MDANVPISQIAASIAPALVSVQTWGDASFINLPMLYPSGAFVTVKISHVKGGLRVSDAGFAYREVESFGADRSFSKAVLDIAESHEVSVAKHAIYADVPLKDVERAIFDVSSASKAVADRVLAAISRRLDSSITKELHVKLDRIFPNVNYGKKISGASSTEWDVTAITDFNGHLVVFQAVTNHSSSVFKASTAFHDLSALDTPIQLVSVVENKAEMANNYNLLAQVGRVLEITQADEAFLRAAA